MSGAFLLFLGGCLIGTALGKGNGVAFIAGVAIIITGWVI